jgi:hypothetical protein
MWILFLLCRDTKRLARSPCLLSSTSRVHGIILDLQTRKHECMFQVCHGLIRSAIFFSHSRNLSVAYERSHPSTELEGWWGRHDLCPLGGAKRAYRNWHCFHLLCTSAYPVSHLPFCASSVRCACGRSCWGERQMSLSVLSLWHNEGWPLAQSYAVRTS